MDINQLIEPQRKGMTVTVGYDEVTGEATEPMVGMGHNPNSPFANDIPQDYINPDELDDRPDSPDDQITESIIELYGDQLDNILDFMEQTLPQEMRDAYDQAIDDADWNHALPVLEQVAEQYFQALAEGMTVTEDDDQSDMEAAMEILEHAATVPPGPERDYLMTAAEVTAGRMDGDKAAAELLAKHGEIIMEYDQKWNL